MIEKEKKNPPTPIFFLTFTLQHTDQKQNKKNMLRLRASKRGFRGSKRGFRGSKRGSKRSFRGAAKRSFRGAAKKRRYKGASPRRYRGGSTGYWQYYHPDQNHWYQLPNALNDYVSQRSQGEAHADPVNNRVSIASHNIVVGKPAHGTRGFLQFEHGNTYDIKFVEEQDYDY